MLSVRPLAICLLAVLTVGVTGSPGLQAGAPAPGTRVFLTGKAKLGAGKLGSTTETRSYRFEFGAGTFMMHELGDADLTGTFTADGDTLDCVLDANSLAALATAETQGLSGITSATVSSHTLTVALGATRTKQKLKGAFKLALDTADGPKKATLNLKGNAVPRRVLVLNDTEDPAAGTSPQVIAALLAAKHVPIFGDFYQTWDGANPPLDEIETVFLLQGVDYSDSMNPGADAALANFVLAGGGLVRTEWSAYEVGQAPSLAIDGLLPVVAPDRLYDYGTEWRVAAKGHPLAKKVHKKFVIPDAGYSVVVPVSGATVVMTNPDNIPMLTTKTFGFGTVVHLNHDMTYTVTDVGPIVRRILVNAAAFTAP